MGLVQVAVAMNPPFPLTRSALKPDQNDSTAPDQTERARCQNPEDRLPGGGVYLAVNNINRLAPLFLKDPMLNDSFEVADRRSVVQKQVGPPVSLDEFIHGCWIEVRLWGCT